MKTLTPAERQEALKAFVETPDHGLATVDRSTLERALTCPWQAKAVESGRCRTVGIMAEAGEEGHKAFGEALRGWIDSHGAISKDDLRQDVSLAVRNSRPDLQPDAVRAIEPAIWMFADLVYGIHPGNVLAFDGGEDIDRSGQLAIDFPDLGVRYTSELDLLYQGDCPEVLEEVDYKTGWKHHTPELIRDSFQFQSHAVLALEQYPESKALRVRVFDTRHRNMTYGVYFERKRMHEWKVRIRGAIEAWRLSQQDNPPTWPTIEKCGFCPAAAICPVADEPLADLHKDPAGFIAKLVAVEARADAMKELAAKYVDSTGRDIEAGSVRFGRQKPKADRKAPATVYTLKETA
jgi:hypothetical protein